MCLLLIVFDSLAFAVDVVTFGAVAQLFSRNLVTCVEEFHMYDLFHFSYRWYLCTSKSHMRSTPSLKRFSNLALETVQFNSVIRRAQEVCESRGGRPGLPSLISLRFLWT